MYWLTFNVNVIGILQITHELKQLCAVGMSPKQVEIFVVVVCVGLTFRRAGVIVKLPHSNFQTQTSFDAFARD